MDIKLPKLVGLAYSVVVNNKDAEPYCEIYVIEEDPLTKKKIEYNKENISLKPIEADNDIEFTEKELEAEVRKKIKFPQPHQPKPQPRQQTASKKWLKDLFSWPFGDSWRVHREQDVPEKAQPRKFEKPGDLENLDIKKLTNAFAKGFIEYASSKEDYSAFMEKVLTTMLSRGGGLVDAIKSAGGKQENGAKCFADLHEYLVAQIAEAALKDATGEKKNMPLLEFMLNFVNNSKYDQSEVIERYVPNFLGVNPIVTEFAYHVIEVVDTRSSIPRYRGEWDKAYTSWLCKVVSRILKENATLEEAILNVGEAKPNSVLGGSDVWFYLGERKKFLQKVMAGKYDDAALNFMNLFNNPATRDTAIVNYAHSVIENYTKSEQDEIDALVENKGNETEKKDDGSK